MNIERYEHLTLSERQVIYKMLGKGKKEQEISKDLNRPRSTINRELKRNRPRRELRRHLSSLELAQVAHQLALKRRSDSKRGERNPLKLVLVRDYIIECLEKGRYSPEDISMKIDIELGIDISGKTIRRWIFSRATELRQYLACKGKKRKNRATPSKRQFSDGTSKRSIHEREEVVTKRERVGDYEADLIVCRQSRVCILSVRERKTRKCWLRLLPNRESETVRSALIGIFANIPATLRHTCTFDNGSEFAKAYEVEKLLNLKSYWCDAYCSWQKGSVEEQNKEVRRHVPKGSDLSKVTVNKLHLVEFYMNDKPRTCLNGQSSEELWQSALAEARKSVH